MRFALVFNPFKYKVHEENLKVVQKYFGLFPPLSLAWVASIAEGYGHQAMIVDARTLNLSLPETLDRLRGFKPDIIGFMLTTYMFQDTLKWIRFLKENLKVPVVVGGYNLRVYPRESISHPEIDFGVVEHAIHTVPLLFEQLGKQKPDFGRVPGLAYKRNGEIIVTPHPQRIDFNSFPNPARHLLPNSLYAEFPTQRKNFTVMVTSLGCPMHCTFCEAGGTPYSPRSPEAVVSEMQECYTKYNIREIDIFDYEFTALRSRVMNICSQIKEKGLNLDWACRSRIDHIDEELLKQMKQAGCKRIYFGIESGVQEILDRINKGLSLKSIRDTVNLTRNYGIQTLGFFLIGAPGETRQTIKQTVRFAKSLNFDYVQFSKCLAKPLTGLWRTLVRETGKDYWREWILGQELDRTLPRPWTALSNQTIDRLAKGAYVSYYCRAAYLLRAISKVRSLTELKRKVGAFIDMLFKQEHISTPDDYFQAYNENFYKKKT